MIAAITEISASIVAVFLMVEGALAALTVTLVVLYFAGDAICTWLKRRKS